ncbi:MAG: hypothetical protein P4L50_29425 [Anaerolineaceae bacterium]|nr:hypothetical protein [Anaerolineaceae bacterium]
MNRSPWLLAFINPINILMLVAAVAAGLIAAWWLFPEGLLFWLGMMIKIATDPSVRINQKIQERSGLPQRFEKVFNRIEKSQVSLYNSLSPAKPPVKKTFAPIQAAVNDLVEHTYQLCVKMTPMENYQQVNASSNPENELGQLDRLVDTIDDPSAKKGYDAARQKLQEKVNQKKAADDRLSQTDALLISISTGLENLMAEVVRLQAMKVEDIKQQIPGLVEKMKTQMNQVQAFEQQH